MKKLTLNVETLSVETFETDTAAKERGTVHAHEVETPKCVVTGGIDSCWCTEYAGCLWTHEPSCQT